MGASQVVERTFGPALVAVNCVYLGCVESVEIAQTESSRDLSCDRRLGVDGIFHFDPSVTITLQASDFTMANMAIALDTTGTSTWAGTATSTLEEVAVTWGGSTGAWTSSIGLNQEISGTVAMFNDAAGSVEWTQAESGTVTVSTACTGAVALTSSGTAEPSAILYATYAWGDQVTSGSTIIQPTFGSTAIDRQVVIVHKKAQQNTVNVWRFWRGQVVRNVTVNYDNTSDADVAAPITIRALVDTVGHPLSPLFDLSEVALSGWTPDYQPYTNLVNTYPVT